MLWQQGRAESSGSKKGRAGPRMSLACACCQAGAVRLVRLLSGCQAVRLVSCRLLRRETVGSWAPACYDEQVCMRYTGRCARGAGRCARSRWCSSKGCVPLCGGLGVTEPLKAEGAGQRSSPADAKQRAVWVQPERHRRCSRAEQLTVAHARASDSQEPEPIAAVEQARSLQ